MRERSKVFEIEAEAINQRYEESVSENIQKREIVPEAVLAKH